MRAFAGVLAGASALLIGASGAALPAASAGGTADGAKATGGRAAPASVRWGGNKWGDPLADLLAKDAKGKNKPEKDPGSLATVTDAIGARSVWADTDAAGQAITGQGVTVALLDTGIATSAPGLDAAGKVIAGPDLSFEANSPDLRGGDNFGHGTHLAGIIAARDPVAVDTRTGRPKPSGADVQLGVAPDARLLAVKLGTRDGSTDVSQVIAGLDWVVQHRNDNGMRIRVLNLAYGTESTQSYRSDPLAAAVENAWQHGIVVVVSAGNDGVAAGSLTDPAVDPFVIAVGASDPQGKVNGWKKPVVASFSSRGTADRHVDLVAPGTSIASLRDPGSFVDVNNPEGLVAGDSTGRLFRGSGTSQAAAVVSGSVALLLQAYPDLTPDQIKSLLVRSAQPVSGSSAIDSGAGELDVNGALLLARAGALLASVSAVLPAASLLLPSDSVTQTFSPSSGLGSLEAARGGSNLVDPDTGSVLSGEIDVQGKPWTPAAWRLSSVNATSWSGGRWNGSGWSGNGWDGANWTSAAWDGARWTGARWTDLSWDGARWTGARWTGARWTGARWTDWGWQ